MNRDRKGVPGGRPTEGKALRLLMDFDEKLRKIKALTPERVKEIRKAREAERKRFFGGRGE